MSHDTLGHIKISVCDIKKSKLFYSKLFAHLGFTKVADHPDAAGWKSPVDFGFWIEEAQIKSPAYIFGAPGLHHFCFKAQSPDAVDTLYHWLLKENIPVCDAPAAYPQYTKDYYAVFFTDPDGMKLEYAFY